MSLAAEAQPFFSRLGGDSAAVAYLKDYPLVVHLVTPEERLIVDIRNKSCESQQRSAGSVGLWDLELEGTEEALRGILVGAYTLGEGIYRGRVFVPEEKSKHNLVCALGQAIRLTRERMPRAALAPRAGTPNGVS